MKAAESEASSFVFEKQGGQSSQPNARPGGSSPAASMAVHQTSYIQSVPIVSASSGAVLGSKVVKRADAVMPGAVAVKAGQRAHPDASAAFHARTFTSANRQSRGRQAVQSAALPSFQAAWYVI